MGVHQFWGRSIEQAHSYAAHAKVGANYFLLCGGQQIEVFETLSGPECKPIVSIPISEIDKRFHELENILSPVNLEKYCRVHYDLALKLCSGLGLKAEIHSGEYGMDYWTYRIYMNGEDMTAQFKVSVPQLADFEKQLEMLANEFPLRIAGGSAERNENGQIVAHVSFLGATKNNLAGMKLLGVDEMTFATNEKFLSTDPSSPSVFESTADFKMDQGTMMPQLLGGMMALEAHVDGDFFVSARIYKDGDHLLGEYVALTNYRFGAASVSMELDYIGKFTLRLMN